jgi:hypothetical protein
MQLYWEGPIRSGEKDAVGGAQEFLEKKLLLDATPDMLQDGTRKTQVKRLRWKGQSLRRRDLDESGAWENAL